MNQFDLFRKQLMPNENIRIRLNVDGVPTVRCDDEKMTPKTVRRQLLRTSTPKKNNCEEQNSDEFLIDANVENKNDKGIQCDMDNETNATESFDFSSDISSTDDESETTYE
ncbi:THAP domain-containing protein 2 [Aphis craccivora]|uniref:THAP domain-containing protein 2 n=1 Tax=Aphis craccivora TaxID=307492 RepID=A0A6G0ZM33_APHCR|nr:THAP domain-containing protein 2 [Aphis craccivora]